MKWGVRRYQKEDGTLTNAGKKHYSNAKKRTLQIGSIAAYTGAAVAMKKGKQYYDMYKMDNIFDPGSKFGKINKRNAKIATGAAVVSALLGANLALKYNKIRKQEKQERREVWAKARADRKKTKN